MISKAILTSITLLFSSLAFSQEKAPNWSLKTQEGTTISLAQYQGKPIVLHFWATWCPYCKKLQPTLVALTNKYKESGLELVAISFNEDEGVLPQSELEQRGYQFKTAVNGDDIAQLYGVKGTPTTYFINKKGEIVFKSTSSNTQDPRLELAIQEIIR